MPGPFSFLQDDELHYAELSLTNMPSGSSGASKKGQPMGGVGVVQHVVQQQQQQQQGQVQHPHQLLGGTLPHGSSMRKLLPTIPATATLQRHKPNAGGMQHPHQHAPPPTYDYDYFEEPTIYAQIDAYKTMQVDTGVVVAGVGAGAGSGVNGAGASISSPGSHGTPRRCRLEPCKCTPCPSIPVATTHCRTIITHSSRWRAVRRTPLR